MGAVITKTWKALGRRLGISESELEGINEGHGELAEQGYHMLMHWRHKQGSAATYQALCDGLNHNLVQRKDLAEKFCHIDGNYFAQYKSNVGKLV